MVRNINQNKHSHQIFSLVFDENHRTMMKGRSQTLSWVSYAVWLLLFRNIVVVCAHVSTATDSGLTVVFPSRNDGSRPDPIHVPLRSMVISAEVVDAVAQVTMLQEFETSSNELTKNDDDGDSNAGMAVYRLPLYDQAAVTQFEVHIGDRFIE